MARITQAQWKKYISRLRQINDTAADEFREYVISQGGYANIDRQRLIDFAYGISTKYGEASAALSAEMYDAVAELSGVTVPAAVPAETATRAEVSKTVNGIIKNTHSDAVLAQGVGKLVKQAGADTILSNAYRDRPKGKGSKRRHSGALVAWIPSGDTCPFCLTLASKGWQNQTEWGAKNHAEHIHANCDCTYGVKFNDKLEYDGYDPDEYKEMYDNADGSTRDEKINSMRRMQYQDPATRDKINAQKRAAYAEKKSLDNARQIPYNKAALGKNIVFKTGNMTTEEFIEYRREIEAARNIPTVTLGTQEYQMVKSAFNQYIYNAKDTDLQKRGIVMKEVRDHMYTAVNYGFDNYRFIGKERLD